MRGRMFSATLAAGEDVRLSGFGNFTLHEKRARPGRNPKNGEQLTSADPSKRFADGNGQVNWLPSGSHLGIATSTSRTCGTCWAAHRKVG